MDLRRVNTQDTPYITSLINSYPWVKIKTLPSTELVPTLVTGVYPHEHGVWQVKLKSNQRPSSMQKPIDKLPDILTTTFQCLIHFLNHSFDLATIPSRRLRLFELKRFKYTRRQKSHEILLRIGGGRIYF